MKRASQFAAAFVALLLTLQPVLAGAACAASGMTGSACPMGMSDMGADCPMAYGLAPDCNQDCCNHSAPKVTALPAAPIKPRLLAASVAVSSAVNFDFAVAALPNRQPVVTTASPPPLYLLNRVFRI